jgi:hypothetical protein
MLLPVELGLSTVSEVLLHPFQKHDTGECRAHNHIAWEGGSKTYGNALHVLRSSTIPMRGRLTPTS